MAAAFGRGNSITVGEGCGVLPSGARTGGASTGGAVSALATVLAQSRPTPTVFTAPIRTQFDAHRITLTGGSLHRLATPDSTDLTADQPCVRAATSPLIGFDRTR